MSKKSRKRNRRILGALAAGLGAMALMKGRRANQMSGMETVSDAQKVASQLGTGDVTGTEYPGANKVVDTAPKTNWISPRMRGHGDQSGVTGQTTRGDYAKRMRNRVTGVDAPPSILNPYRTPRVHNRFNRPVNVSYAKGGRVKGVGKAKRGFGRALKGGK